MGLGTVLIHHSLASPADPKPPTPPAAFAPPVVVTPPALPAPSGPGPRTTAGPAAQQLPRSAPKRIVIAQIGVNAPFSEISLDASGHLVPPPVTNKNLVGWYKGGVSPGERGTSVVVGHVDTKTGPAVFVLLRTLKPGSRLDITRADGVVTTFKVDSVETFTKAKFPDKRVYAGATTPQLRLITCGGTYNHSAHEYESNVVVFAHLASVKHS
ncbi:class F sortase [Streptomyces chiangmaiensis]